MKQQEGTGAQWRPQWRCSGQNSSVSGTIKIFKRLVQITCCHAAWLLRPATTVWHAENPYTQTLHADMTVPRGAKHDDPLQAVFHQAYYSFFHCLVMPCHCRARLYSCRLFFFSLSRRALTKRTLLVGRERGCKLWDAVLSLRFRNWNQKYETTNFKKIYCTCMKGMLLWEMIAYTFRNVLTSSFLQRSNLVTLCSSHCCTTALLSAESPSRSGHLPSFTRWQEMVTSPTSGGPLLLCRTGTCKGNDTQKHRAREDKQVKPHFIRNPLTFSFAFSK